MPATGNSLLCFRLSWTTVVQFAPSSYAASFLFLSIYLLFGLLTTIVSFIAVCWFPDGLLCTRTRIFGKRDNPNRDNTAFFHLSPLPSEVNIIFILCNVFRYKYHQISQCYLVSLNKLRGKTTKMFKKIFLTSAKKHFSKFTTL